MMGGLAGGDGEGGEGVMGVVMRGWEDVQSPDPVLHPLTRPRPSAHPALLLHRQPSCFSSCTGISNSSHLSSDSKCHPQLPQKIVMLPSS